ncbi:hypothetical protein HDU97_003285 [Phlyctochytrium planicorne]|nr:hypothetical protein HDU97_003285 [Phlyctochytrium planicorne]
MLKEDLSGFPTEASTYEMDYSQKKHFSGFGEPRYIRPKLEPNASLKQKPSDTRVPTQREIDKLLYVSLYQSSFNRAETSIGSKFEPAPTPSKSIPSLYQESYVNPTSVENERKVLEDNRGMRQTYMREASGKGMASLMRLHNSPLPPTSYKSDFDSSQPIVEKGMPPSYSPVSHPLATRQIVAKAFKYRR